MKNCKTSEVVAKLPALEKSMILSQFVGAAMRRGPHRQAHSYRRVGFGGGAAKWLKKGDFAGAGSFATASSN
jgi:hypothetical protein